MGNISVGDMRGTVAARNAVSWARSLGGRSRSSLVRAARAAFDARHRSGCRHAQHDRDRHSFVVLNKSGGTSGAPDRR